MRACALRVCAHACVCVCVCVCVCPCVRFGRARARGMPRRGGGRERRCARAVRPHLQLGERRSAGRQLHLSLPVSGSIPAVQCWPQDNSKHSERADIRCGTGPRNRALTSLARPWNILHGMSQYRHGEGRARRSDPPRVAIVRF